MSKTIVTLSPGESIVAVVPQFAHGPGWSNAPCWVYIRTAEGKLRCECIQPEGRTRELHALFKAGEAMCAALLSAVPVRRTK